METIQNFVGNQEDWGNYITNVETFDTIFLDWLPVGSKPVSPLFNYQLDKYRRPRQNRHVDGAPWSAAFSGGDNRKKINSVIQWFDHGVSVSKLSQDVTNNAAVADELANEVMKAMKEIGQDIECAALDDNAIYEDDGVNGYRMRSVGAWLYPESNSFWTSETYPVPAGYRLPDASHITTAWASLTEDGIRGLLQSMWETAKTSETVTAFGGGDVMKGISDFQYRTPGSAASSPTMQSTMQRQWKDKTVSRTVRRYEGDFMDVEYVPTPWMTALSNTITSTAARGRTYYLHRSKWEWRWNQKPKTYPQPFTGGSYEVFMDALGMLVCKNSMGEGCHRPA